MSRVSGNDVARWVGVARATVSDVLNERPDKTISAANRRRVLEAAREPGYVPSAAAAAPVRRTFPHRGAGRRSPDSWTRRDRSAPGRRRRPPSSDGGRCH